MNAANEIAVSYFLNNKAKFNSIFDSVDYTMGIFEGRPSQYDLNLQDLLEVDKEAKKIATDFLSKL
jgi:1-deoxy-D-xylulose 5-phosphate reductoisomerase